MAPVILHVYDLSDHNGWMQCAGIGIFHSGVEGAFFCQSTACCGRRSCEVSLVVPTKRQEGTVSTANKAKRALSKLSTAHMWRSASCHHLVCQRSGLSVSVTLTGQQQRNLIWQEMFAVYGSEYAFGGTSTAHSGEAWHCSRSSGIATDEPCLVLCWSKSVNPRAPRQLTCDSCVQLTSWTLLESLQRCHDKPPGKVCFTSYSSSSIALISLHRARHADNWT